MDQSKKHVRLSGRVQGVGFRHFTKQNAQRLNINGWVKNLPDGDVEAVFVGEEDNVNKMLEEMKKGPRSARVDDLSVDESSDKLDETFSGFSVRH
ncbi:acylphosphatase [Rhodohalobacter sp. 8-1]|uniref:acylphosphatase n=1 Tax=Rhodohalobacter sp. 8-1 TaxID=3131972 RepID=UPI0030ECBE54